MVIRNYWLCIEVSTIYVGYKDSSLECHLRDKIIKQYGYFFF